MSRIDKPNTNMRLIITLILLLSAKVSATAARDSQPRGKLEPLDAEELDYAVQQRYLSSSSSSSATSPSSTTNSTTTYRSSPAYGINWFADSENKNYSGYQQAWRYLGHLVKCGYPSDRYDSGGGGHSHSNDKNQWRGNNYCQRYLVWASYVDLNYQGGGTGEYHYYNTKKNAWDYSACNAHGNGRCAPMDCHMTNTTTWTLLGVYKEAEYFGNDAFFEQLFKHEGYCVWNDATTYEFMSDSRKSSWTQGCVDTGMFLKSSSGQTAELYIDLKPTVNGNMTYGLYLDYICKTEYKGNATTVDKVAKSMGLLYGKYLEMWNDGLEPYKVCQPCKAYNLNVNYPYSGGYSDHYIDSTDVNDMYFQCNDDADYSNVNQCMKFRTHAQLEVASFEDLVIATEQQGILEVNVGGTIFGTAKMSYEDQIYKEKLQKAKEASEAAEYQALLASVPPAAPLLLLGSASVALGGAALLGVFAWIIKRHACGNSQSMKVSLLSKEEMIMA